MRLTTRSEYALLALLHLARSETEDPVSVDAIATAKGIPAKYLEHIMHSLRTAHYVRSVKGRAGGYLLARDPSEIRLAEVIRLFDGALAPTESVSTYFYETTPIESEARLLAIFQEIRDYIAQKLDATSLADVQ